MITLKFLFQVIYHHGLVSLFIPTTVANNCAWKAYPDKIDLHCLFFPYHRYLPPGNARNNTVIMRKILSKLAPLHCTSSYWISYIGSFGMGANSTGYTLQKEHGNGKLFFREIVNNVQLVLPNENFHPYLCLTVVSILLFVAWPITFFIENGG